MKLFEHQIEALEKTKEFNRCAYYLDMGLGKTFIGSEKMISFGTHGNLVICQKSKVIDWFKHFEEFYSKQGYTFLNLTNKLEYEYFTENFDNKEFPNMIGIINYDLIYIR